MYNRKHALYYHAMVLPGILMLILFSYIPMFGIIMAFEKYVPAKGFLGSKWVGLKNFQTLFRFADFKNAVGNTVIIALLKIVFGILVPVFFALVLNECRAQWIKRPIQTIVYLPHILSWVILAVIFQNLLSLNGLFNKLVSLLGGTPDIWLIRARHFRKILIVTDVWQSFGYGAIIYLAARTSISPDLYEAASIDGATRMQRIWHITLPGIVPTIVLMSTLALRNILNAGFDQVYNLYCPLVYSTGDIIDTYVYRMGLVNLQYSLSTAVGLVKSAIGMVLIVASYFLADRLAGYSIF